MDDELLTAIAEALREHGVENARAVVAAADAAVLILGRDRCVCRASVHRQHHLTAVPNCPWCRSRETPAPPSPRRRRTDEVPTQGML